MPTGQRRLHEALLKLESFSVIHVVGDAETMAVSEYTIHHGWVTERVVGDLASLKARIHSWWVMAEGSLQ